jgi:superfamily II DNA or RNA helicase
MTLRPYQQEWVTTTLQSLLEQDRVLSVAATGAGKTIMAAEICKRYRGRILFLADAQTLVNQAEQKISKYTGEIVGVEMSESHDNAQSRIIIATTQSIARRLNAYPREYFTLIIIDEAHRNTLGDQAQKVLTHFHTAQTIGITATPFRADKRNLSTYYQIITPCDAGLKRLIEEGHLAKIQIKSVPSKIDISAVKTTQGDYAIEELGEAIEPHIEALADILIEHASDRKTVAFFPLIKTSKAFCAALQQRGQQAIHVDGTDSTALKTDWKIACNASILTTGWDEPSVDCVFICRPTKSLTLYSQMVGRGTRNHPGKQNLLVLDPLFQSDKHDIIRAHRLIAETKHEDEDMSKIIEQGTYSDLFEIRELGKTDREKTLREKLKENQNKSTRTIDPIDFFLMIDRPDIAERENEYRWEENPPSEKQLQMLAKNGFDPNTILTKGHASRLLDILFSRRDQKLASPKQVRLLQRWHIKDPHKVTFTQASEIITQKFVKSAPKPTTPKPTPELPQEEPYETPF